MFKKEWDKVSLFKFQQIEAISGNDGMADIDKSLFSTCVLFDLTEFQLDNMPLKKASKLIAKVNKTFSTPFTPLPVDRIGKWYLNYDIGSMTFGQYIELAFYLSNKPLANAHKVMASISHRKGKANDSAEHGIKSDFFLTAPITQIAGSLNKIIQAMQDFHGQYKGLFGLDTEVHGEEAKVHSFNKRYGWMYSAEQVAEYQRISLDDAYGLNVRAAFHALNYLKAKAKYENDQMQMNKK